MHEKQTYRVKLQGPLPVDAYVWLKNNQISYRSNIIWGLDPIWDAPSVNHGDSESETCTEYIFDCAEDAAWFALKWA